ncbi:MAG: hypothetical protein KDA96_22525 [Planctomycetaceae bacterium]|nr:hypothetical protein [Planctomycetaceae bacterium]
MDRNSLSDKSKSMLPTYFLIAWFLLPLLLWATVFCVRRRVGRILVCIACLASVVAGIFLLANYVWALDAQLLAEVDKYEPGTPEAQRASEEWASDTGRSFLLLLSPVVTAIWYGVLFLSLFGLQWMVTQKFAAKNASDHSSRESQPADPRGGHANPYQSPGA